MSDFKWRHFRGEIILWAVRWYCKYGISYRELEEMMTERGNPADHSTIFRWVQRYAPEMEKRLKWYLRSSLHQSWRVDETYVKVKGRWVYLYRAVDKRGDAIDFYLSPTRNAKAAKRFLGKALKGRKDWEMPYVINTDQGSQFTSEAFTGVLKDHDIDISMDGKGRWVDNVFVERLWRSVKYEDVYLRAYETPAELRAGLTRYFAFYNTKRRHSALDRHTPDAVYFDPADQDLAA